MRKRILIIGLILCLPIGAFLKAKWEKRQMLTSARKVTNVTELKSFMEKNKLRPLIHQISDGKQDYVFCSHDINWPGVFIIHESYMWRYDSAGKKTDWHGRLQITEVHGRQWTSKLTN